MSGPLHNGLLTGYEDRVGGASFCLFYVQKPRRNEKDSNFAPNQRDKLEYSREDCVLWIDFFYGFNGRLSIQSTLAEIETTFYVDEYC